MTTDLRPRTYTPIPPRLPVKELTRPPRRAHSRRLIAPATVLAVALAGWALALHTHARGEHTASARHAFEVARDGYREAASAARATLAASESAGAVDDPAVGERLAGTPESDALLAARETLEELLAAVEPVVDDSDRQALADGARWMGVHASALDQASVIVDGAAQDVTDRREALVRGLANDAQRDALAQVSRLAVQGADLLDDLTAAGIPDVDLAGLQEAVTSAQALAAQPVDTSDTAAVERRVDELGIAGQRLREQIAAAELLPARDLRADSVTNGVGLTDGQG